MGRAPCCNGEHSGLNKGPWSHDEDEKLKSFIFQNPNTSWRMVPPKAGLLRCGKSCRLRWMNYLRPDIRRGNFTPEEENLIIQLHAAVGNKWAVIASQLPGRTDNEIKNLWNTKLRKVLVLKGLNPVTHQPLCNPLLSDYIKQWVKSIENTIISGLITNSSTSNTSISTAATNENSSSSGINIPSLDEFLAPYMSSPSDPTLTTKLPDQPHLLGTKSDGPTFESRSWIGESSQSNHENLIVDDFMLEGEACLSNNLGEYLRDDFCEDSVTSTDPLNLVDHFDYWNWS